MEGIQDMTETNLVNLRKVIYLTIMNALNYEEAVHKLLKIQIKEGQEVWMAETCVRTAILICYAFRLNL
jgi:pre-mRNA-splicing factor CWC22